jgi:hypothetical protein
MSHRCSGQLADCGMKPIIHQASTADLRAENRIIKGGHVRDVDAQPDFAAAQRSNSDL